MSFSEAQIRYFTRDELRKIIDAGLIMTETTKPAEREGTKTATPVSPFQPSTSPLPTPNNITQLIDVHTENGVHYINPKHYLQTPDFNTVNDWVKQQHGEYVKATSNVPGHWRIKA
jgi:hypothetical protein